MGQLVSYHIFSSRDDGSIASVDSRWLIFALTLHTFRTSTLLRMALSASRHFLSIPSCLRLTHRSPDLLLLKRNGIGRVSPLRGCYLRRCPRRPPSSPNEEDDPCDESEEYKDWNNDANDFARRQNSFLGSVANLEPIRKGTITGGVAYPWGAFV